MSDENITSTQKLLNLIRESENGTAEPSTAPQEQAPAPEPPVKARMEPEPATARIVPQKPAATAKPGKGSRMGVEVTADGIEVVLTEPGSPYAKVRQASTVKRTSADQTTLPSDLRDGLNGLFSSGKPGKIWAVLPSSALEIWSLKIPRVADKELVDTVTWVARKDHTIDESKSVFDFAIQGVVQDAGIEKYLVSAILAERTAVEELTNAFSGAGYSLEGATAAPFALQSLLRKDWIETSPDECVAAVEIGSASTRIDIFVGDMLMQSRDVKAGLESMLHELQHGYNSRLASDPLGMPQEDEAPAPAGNSGMSVEQALRVFMTKGGVEAQADADTPGMDFDAEDVFKLVAPAAKRLVRQIEWTFEHSMKVNAHPPVSKILLVSPIAGHRQLTEFLQAELGLRIERLDPLSPEQPAMAATPLPLSDRERLELSTATGAALSDRSTPNLLNTFKDKQRGKKVTRTQRMIAAACMLAVLAASVYAWTLDQRQSALRAEAQSLDTQLAAFAPLVTKDMAQKMIERVTARQGELREYSRKYYALAAINEVTRMTPDNIKLLDLKVEVLPAPAGSKAKGSGGTLVLDGFIRGNSDLFDSHLSSYLYQLQESPLFGSTVVTDRNEEIIVGQDGKVLHFILTIKLA